MLHKRLSELNLLKTENLKNELYLVLKETTRIQQSYIMNNDLMRYQEYKEKSSILLDIWRQINNPKIHEIFVERYIDAIIQLIEDIGRTNEGFSIPRDPYGKLVWVGTDIIGLFKLHKHMYVEKAQEKSIWNRIIKQRKEKKSIVDILTQKKSKNKCSKNFDYSHIFLQIKAIIIKSDAKTELRFSLYDRKTDKFITDSFHFLLTKTNYDFLVLDKKNLKCVFRDIEEVSNDLFLVCKLFRNEDNHLFPLGVFCVPIKELRELKSGKIYNPNPKISNIYTHPKMSNFIHLHKLIIVGDKSIQIAKNTKSIMVSLFCFRGQFDQIIKRNVENDFEIINNITEDNNSISTRERNDMIICLDSGKFTQESYKYVIGQKVKQVSKKKNKNIQITAFLIDKNGEKIKNCLQNASITQRKPFGSFKTFIYFHENIPIFDERFYINLNEEDLHKSFLYLEYSHISVSNREKSFTFAFSVIPLANENIIIGNDTKNISVYCASNKIGKNIDLSGIGNFLKRKDKFVISTFYNSTTYSENVHLNSLLHLKKFKNDIKSILQNVAQLEKVNFVKCFRKVFDSLFLILEENRNDEIKDLCFDCIIQVLYQLTSESTGIMNSAMGKFYLLEYINKDFNFPKAHINILKLVKEKLENESRTSELVKMIKSIEYVFKMIVVSEKKNDNSSFSSTKKALECILIFVEKSKEIKSKELILKEFPSIIKTLIQIMSGKDIIETYFSCVKCILKYENEIQIRISKFTLLYEITTLSLDFDIELRKILYNYTLRKLRGNTALYSMENDEKYYWISIVKKICQYLNEIIDELSRSEVIIELIKNLPDLIFIIEYFKKSKQKQTIKIDRPTSENNFSDVNKNLSNATICMWQILLFSFEKMTNISFWDVISISCKNKLDFADKLFSICIDNCKDEIFEKSWIAMKVVRVNCFSKLLINSIDFFSELVAPTYRKESVRNILELFSLLIADTIFDPSESKTKVAYIKNNIDVDKVKLIQCILKICNILGDKIIEFLEFFISKILVMKIEDKITEDYCAELYYQIMKIEYNKEGTITKLENETFNSLQNFCSQKENEYDIISKVLEKVEIKLSKEEQEKFKEAGNDLILRAEQMKKYVSKLTASDDMHGENYEYTKIDILSNLLNILEEKRIDRKVYFNYFKNFVALHTQCKNWVEAGIALLKFITIYDWDLEESRYINKETRQSPKKEKIEQYNKCIDYFSKGKDWERCINVCSLLEDYYLKEIFDYNSVADTLNIKAKFYKNLHESGTRFYPYYYRIMFFGEFDNEFKNYEWVYRSRHLEQLNPFIERIMKNYPDSTLHKKDEKDKNSKLKSLSVTTLSIAEKEINDGDHITKHIDSAKKYCENNDIDLFFFTEPIQRGDKNSLKTLWTKKIYLQTETKFPSIHRKSRVIKRWEKMVSPIATATEAIHLKNTKLKSVMKKLKENNNNKTELKILSVNLQGIIDAAVSGGTKVYIEEFFKSKPTYLNLYPEEKEKASNFINSINEQQKILNEGLNLLKANIAGYEALYNHLNEMHLKTVEKNQALLSNVD